ncbi:hypothetical protein BV22DRAFT_1076829, partial [Leucogyrophana mollusca]
YESRATSRRSTRTRAPPTSTPPTSKPKPCLSKQCNRRAHVEPAKEARSAHLILNPTFRVGAVL